MARYSDAIWRPLPENATQPAITPRLVILHTAVDAPGPTDLWKYFARSDVGAESHFWVAIDGTVTQFLDTNVRADANKDANNYSISIETEDEGNPEGKPWTPEQVASIIKLVRWACVTHGIPMEVAQAPTGRGIGWHSMWNAADGSTPWSIHRGKTCPGTARKPQIPDIIRAVSHGSVNPPPMPPPTGDEWMEQPEWFAGAVAKIVDDRLARANLAGGGAGLQARDYPVGISDRNTVWVAKLVAICRIDSDGVEKWTGGLVRFAADQEIDLKGLRRLGAIHPDVDPSDPDPDTLVLDATKEADIVEWFLEFPEVVI